MNPSHQLLRQYVTHGDDAAFRELVTSHVNLVYSAALRVLHDDKSLAEDVVQAVFTELAKRAGSISEEVILSGWLYRTAIHLATRRQRTEMRRQHREREAVAMQALDESDGELWASVAPELDAAMNQLNERERNAIVLRYFEKQDHRSVGILLGLTDDAAQKCVSRALEKLRAVLNSRGIRSTASVLSIVLLANSLQAAPSALVQRLPSRALAGAATSLGLFARWKLAVVAAGLVATGAVIPIIFQHLQDATVSSGHSSVTVVSSLANPLKSETKPTGKLASASAAPLVSELVRQAATQLRGGSQNVTDTTNALNLLSKIPLNQIRPALMEVAMVQDTAAQALLYKYLLGRWAETNPNEAMAYSREQLPTACRSSGMEGILDAWSVRNTTAALEWTGKSLAVAEGNDSLLTTLYRNVAHQDLDKAFVMLAALESAGDRSYALRGIMTNVNDAGHRTRLLDHIGKLQESDLKLQAMRSLVERWADHDAPAAAEWTLKRESEHERSRLMDSLGLVWLQRHPQAAADWWFGHVPDSSTLTKIVNVWAHQDPNSAGVWLNKHATGPMGDDARMTFARQVQEMDPESAFAWAETITLPELREATVAHVYRSWKSRDPAGAVQFLENAKSSWPAQRVQQLESKPKPQP